MINLNFKLRNSKDSEKTQVQLKMYYEKKKRFVYGLNLKGNALTVYPHNWDIENDKPITKSKIKPKSEIGEIETIEYVIKELNYKLPPLINEFYKENTNLNNKKLKQWCDEILNIGNVAIEESKDDDNNDEGCIYDYISSLIDNMTKGKKLKPDTTKYGKGTIKQYRNLRDRLNEFNSNIKFDDIGKEFYDEFIYYLNNESNYTISTVGKFVKDLKSMLSMADMDGINKNKTYLEKWFIKPKPRIDLVEKTDVVLTVEEVDKLYNLQLNGNDNEYLDKYRDVFLIGVFTGLRVGDYSTIKKEMIKNDESGYFIELLSEKKKNNMTISINDDRLISILKKYDFNPPNLFQQKINDYIKVICRKIEMNEEIIYYEQRGGDITKHKEPKNQLITSHTARRTFITIKLLEGWSYSQIKEFTGHKSDAMIRRYDKATPRQKQLAVFKKMSV